MIYVGVPSGPMSPSGDRDRGPYDRVVLVGLTVAASTITADLATFAGPLQTSRVVLFVIAGLLAAAVTLLPLLQKKTSCRNHPQGLSV